jgi:hypothetical protein
MPVFRRMITLSILLVYLGGCAPGLMSDVVLESATPPVVAAATATAGATAPPTPLILSPTPAPDIDGFVEQLEAAINAKDGNTLRSVMRDTFAMGYWQSDEGFVTAGDALKLIEEDFLSGPGPVVFRPDVDPATISGGSGFMQDGGSTRVVFSTGWGRAGTDQALVYVAVESTGQPYWYGILYAHEGFIELKTTATEESPPTLLPTAASPAYGAAVYETDFRSGWPGFDLGNGKTRITATGYEVEALLSLWLYSTQVQRSAFYAELEATPVTCPYGKALYGLVFHYVDDSRFRFFAVTCSGGYALYQRTGPGSSGKLVEGSLPAGIDPATGTHRLAVQAIDNTLVLYADGYLLETVSVSTMTAGDIGIYAETIGGPLTVIFSRLAVFEGQ